MRTPAYENACSPRAAGSSGTASRQPPVNTSASSHTPITTRPAETTFGMKFGPMRA